MRYYDNSATCGNCNGAGTQGYMDYCRECGSRKYPKLAGWGNTRFPLSSAVNGCKPPYIQNSYASKLHPRTAAHIIMEHRINNHR